MRLGIMQPYFFPYWGHFRLIAGVDRWVVFDVVQYNPKSWMSRNRILHPKQGWQYINVPVSKAPHGTAIYDIRVKDREAARTRILGQLEHYRKHAPHFREVRDIVETTFAVNSDRLVDMNVSGLKTVCRYLGVEFHHLLCSEARFELGGVQHAGQWALEIAKQMGASEYLNPAGGQDLFVQSEWDAAAIRLVFLDPEPLTYRCPPFAFVENLSILDVLMWNDAGAVAGVLKRAA